MGEAAYSTVQAATSFKYKHARQKCAASCIPWQTAAQGGALAKGLRVQGLMQADLALACSSVTRTLKYASKSARLRFCGGKNSSRRSSRRACRSGTAASCPSLTQLALVAKRPNSRPSMADKHWFCSLPQRQLSCTHTIISFSSASLLPKTHQMHTQTLPAELNMHCKRPCCGQMHLVKANIKRTGPPCAAG